MKLEEAVRIWLSQKKESTRKSFERRITRCINLIGPSRALTKITVMDVQRYAEEIRDHTFIRDGKREHYSATTIREEFKAVRVFFNWCVKKQLLKISPARLLERPYVERDTSRDKAMSDEDLQTLLAYTQNIIREHAIIRFASETACRRGEVCSLRISNLNLEKHLLFTDPKTDKVVKIYTAVVFGKTGEREVGFYEATAQALRRYLLRRPICDHDFVFVTDRRKAITADYMDLILHRIADAIKRDWDYELTHCNIHAMRHRIGHAMGDNHTPLTLIATKLGHRSEVTTMTYLPKDHKSAWAEAASHSLTPHVPEVKTDNVIDITEHLKRLK
jgi:integrase